MAHYKRWYRHGDPLGGKSAEEVRITVPRQYKHKLRKQRTCGACKEVLPIGEFSAHAAGRAGRRTTCKRCTSDAQLLREWGMTREQYEAKLAEQGGRCAICGAAEGGRGRRFAIDHDHGCCPGKSCGKCIRGLLCDGCNLGLGAFRDNPAALVAAVRYLHEWQQEALSAPESDWTPIRAVGDPRVTDRTREAPL